MSAGQALARALGRAVRKVGQALDSTGAALQDKEGYVERREWAKVHDRPDQTPLSATETTTMTRRRSPLLFDVQSFPPPE